MRTLAGGCYAPCEAIVLRRLAALQDDARPAAVARRRATGQQTARENVKAVVDEGSFVECVRSCWCSSGCRGDAE